MHISVPDYAFNRIFRDFKGNKSARASELMLKGQDSELGEDDIKLVKLYEAEKMIRTLTDENNALKLLNGSLKQRFERASNVKLTKNEQRIKEFQQERGIERVKCSACGIDYNKINKSCPSCKFPNKEL